jgi:hypothetical protein
MIGILPPHLLYAFMAWTGELYLYHRLRVLENVMLKKIFLSKTAKYQEDVENYIISSFMICTPHHINVLNVIFNATKNC